MHTWHLHHPVVTIVVLAEIGIPGLVPIVVFWLLFLLQQQPDNYSKQSRFITETLSGKLCVS